MRRRTLCLFLCSVLLFVWLLFCTSCTSLLGYPPLELNNKVSFVDGDATSIEYEGKIYNEAPYALFYATEERYANSTNEGDVLLGWSGFGYVNCYYSNTAENPFFIYESRMCALYFREDFDYRQASFLIEGTDESILFSDAFEDTDFSYHMLTTYSNVTDMTLRLEDCPRLYIDAKVFSHNGCWYLVGNSDTVVYQLTDAVLAMLDENGIIDKTNA